MMFLSTLVSIILFLSINVAEPSTSGQGNNEECTSPFYLVGDQCLFIDHSLRGTWSQMRDVCLAIEGDLVSLSDANLLYDINQYIKANGIDDISYWVGTTDADHEGNWVWVVDDTPVRMMSPIWGQLNGNQPDGGTDQNCGAITSREFHYLHDEDCGTSTHGVICQDAAQANSTKCLPPFESIGSACFQVYAETEYNWYEALDVCALNNGHLAKLDDANLITDLREYFLGKNIDYLWIDGTDSAEEGNWTHVNGSPVKLGTPFWSVKKDGETQNPEIDTSNNCMAIYDGYIYHFFDYNCIIDYGALCQQD